MKPTRRGIAAASLILGAVMMFAMSLFSMLIDRAAIAGIAATVALAMIVLIKLPIVESFEMLTLKVKLRHQVDEAGELINKIRSSAGVTSKLLYLQLGYMNRMGSVSWNQKRELLFDIDQMLGRLDVSGDQIKEWKRPFLNLISRDLFAILWFSIGHVLQMHQQAAQDALNAYMIANSPIDPADTEFVRLSDEARRFAHSKMPLGDVLTRQAMMDGDAITQDWIPQSLISESEIAALNRIRQEVVSLSGECWKAGTITESAQTYLEKYGERIDTRIQELISSD